MITINNPEILLWRRITGTDGQMWIVTEVNRLVDADNGPYLEFHLVTDAINPRPNGMQTGLRGKVELRLFGDGLYSKDRKGGVFEMYTNGRREHGYAKDIDTADKFINRMIQMLPTNL